MFVDLPQSFLATLLATRPNISATHLGNTPQYIWQRVLATSPSLWGIWRIFFRVGEVCAWRSLDYYLPRSLSGKHRLPAHSQGKAFETLLVQTFEILSILVGQFAPPISLEMKKMFETMTSKAEGCRMHNFKLYHALHKLGPRPLIHFLQCIAHVESWCAVNAAVRRYSSLAHRRLRSGVLDSGAPPVL